MASPPPPNAHSPIAVARPERAAEAIKPERAAAEAIILHDLRAPLGVILAYTQWMLQRLQRPHALDTALLTRHLQAITVAAQHMGVLVDELSDIMAVQNGQPLRLHWETLNLGALVGEVCQLVRAAHEQAPLEVAAPTEVLLVADRVRLTRALLNVMDNALKYSRADQPVTVTVLHRDGWALVTVQDRGVGIPVEELPFLGMAFYRASTARGINGTGLGLASAIAIVEQHGGYLAVESAAGRGTAVSIKLPARPLHHRASARTLDRMSPG